MAFENEEVTVLGGEAWLVLSFKTAAVSSNILISAVSVNAIGRNLGHDGVSITSDEVPASSAERVVVGRAAMPGNRLVLH